MPFDDENSPIDLENIDYDDVLHLYRGWRRAETALKERTLECEALKSRTEKFEDNHERFRNQIQALESVKDLTINLQSQLNMVQSENVYLTNENRRYIEIQQKLDRDMKEEKSHNYRQQLEDARKEVDFHKQKYQEMLLSHKALETMVANESAARQSAENRLSSLDEVTEALRAENSTLRLKMDNTLVRMNQCDHELAHAAEQLSRMAKELAQANEAHELMLTAEAEVGVLKGDIARLLRLMEHYPASQEFLDRWFDSDGLDFMGMGEPSSTHPSDHNSSMITAHNPLGHSYSTSLGLSNHPGEYEDNEYSNNNYNNNRDDEYDQRRPDPDITPSEYAQLKRIYGGDPFPMTKGDDSPFFFCTLHMNYHVVPSHFDDFSSPLCVSMTNDLLSFFLSYTLQPSPPSLLKTPCSSPRFRRRAGLVGASTGSQGRVDVPRVQNPSCTAQTHHRIFEKNQQGSICMGGRWQDVVVCGNRHTILLMHDLSTLVTDS